MITLENIKNHLYKCSSSFKPSLDSYVDIDSYSEKIYNYSITFAKFDGDKLIGLVAAYDNVNEKFGWVTNVSVDSDYQKQGIATVLLNECYKHFIDKKYKSIFLDVFSDNKKAIDLYLKEGFTKHKIKKNKMVLKKDIQKRDYNDEFKDTKDHKYVYNFDFDIMHHYMIESFKTFFVEGNCLELGSFKGDYLTVVGCLLFALTQMRHQDKLQ